MKKVFSIMVLGLALVLSCTKEGADSINEITDHSVVPAGAVEMAAPSVKSTWSTDRRYFDLSFGNDLATTLVGYDALLTPGQYVLGDDQIGNAIKAKTQVGGAAAQAGFITVSKKGSEYIVNAKIDDKVLYWKGALGLKEDPAPLSLSVVQQAQKNQGLVTLQLATPGIEKGYNESWQEVWTGEGGYLALDLYSEDGYLHDGNYNPCAVGGKVNTGEFGIGYDGVLDMGDWGQYPFENWGTCWWEVKDGAATATKITDGLVTVSSEEVGDDTIWTIYWGKSFPREYMFVGAIPALTKPKPISKDPDYLFTDEVTPGDGLDVHAITITDKEGNKLAYLELQTEVGATDLSGDYPATSYASAPGQMRDGYYVDAGDWGIFEGGSWYMAGEEKKYIGAGTATVTVTKIATGAYLFVCEFFSYDATGPDYVPVGGNTGPVYAMTDTVAQDCTDSANNLYTDVESHTLVMKDDDDQFVAQIKLIRSVGTTDLAGEYTVTEYAHEDFTAGNGFDLGVFFGMDAGAYVIGSYYVSDGSIVIIEPGETITVTSAGDNTWKFEGSSGYSFVGKL